MWEVQVEEDHVLSDANQVRSFVASNKRPPVARGHFQCPLQNKSRLTAAPRRSLENEVQQLKDTLQMQAMFTVHANRSEDDMIVAAALLRALNH